MLLLFGQKEGLKAQRILPEKLSNGDENRIKIDIKKINNIRSEIINLNFLYEKLAFSISDSKNEKDISDKAKTCPHCGCPTSNTKIKDKPIINHKLKRHV